MSTVAPPVESMPRHGKWWPAVVGLPALAACVPVFGDWCILSPDSLVYLRSARSLFETLSLPPERTMTPPGLPVVLSPLIYFGEAPFAAIRALHVLAFASSAILAFLLFRDELGIRPAFVVGALAAASGVLVTRAATLLSEPIFTPLALGCILLARRWKSGGGSSAAEVILGALAAASAALVRSMGLVLAPVMLFSLSGARDRSWRTRGVNGVIFAIVFLAPHAAWSIRQSLYPAAHDYGAIWSLPRPGEAPDLSGIALQAARLAEFGPQRLADIKSAIVPNVVGWRLFSEGIDLPASWLIGGAIVLIGLTRLILIRDPVDAFVLLTLSMLALWPWPEGVRLVSPLAPLLIGYAAWAVTRGICRMKAAGARTVAGWVISLFALSIYAADLVATYPIIARRGESAREHWKRSNAMADWLGKHVDNGIGFAPSLCITPPGDNAKVVLLGGCYLARQAFPTFWSPDKGELPPPCDDGGIVFLHRDIESSIFRGGAPGIEIGRADVFIVFRFRSIDA